MSSAISNTDVAQGWPKKTTDMPFLLCLFSGLISVTNLILFGVYLGYHENNKNAEGYTRSYYISRAGACGVLAFGFLIIFVVLVVRNWTKQRRAQVPNTVSY
ncbi:hypothetical protein GGI12_000212 [Dipsacomyces acuminosporus]|nr:hypothetical protein GGI12_000212 [Dipsacomyces acuminosporus]